MEIQTVLIPEPLSLQELRALAEEFFVDAYASLDCFNEPCPREFGAMQAFYERLIAAGYIVIKGERA